jgi:hypothetical protein
MGLEGIVSKRLGSRYVSGRTRDWLKFKNPAAPAVRRKRSGDVYALAIVGDSASRAPITAAMWADMRAKASLQPSQA